MLRAQGQDAAVDSPERQADDACREETGEGDEHPMAPHLHDQCLVRRKRKEKKEDTMIHDTSAGKGIKRTQKIIHPTFHTEETE